MNNNPPPPSEWLESLKRTFSIDSWKEFDWSSHNVVTMGIYTGIGFFVGLFIKKYGRWLLGVALLCTALLVGLSYLDIIAFNIVKFKDFMGINQYVTMNNCAELIYRWILENKAISLCASIGFLIGFIIR